LTVHAAVCILSRNRKPGSNKVTLAKMGRVAYCQSGKQNNYYEQYGENLFHPYAKIENTSLYFDESVENHLLIPFTKKKF
jgi:hypothetical protein